MFFPPIVLSGIQELSDLPSRKIDIVTGCACMLEGMNVLELRDCCGYPNSEAPSHMSVVSRFSRLHSFYINTGMGKAEREHGVAPSAHSACIFTLVNFFS